jgi:hypothetical protein
VSAARVIGIPWYSPEDYERIRGMMVDPETMAPGFELWRASAQNNEQVARDAGLEVVRVPIKPDVFAAWCAEHDLPLNGSARMRFAREAAQSQSSCL